MKTDINGCSTCQIMQESYEQVYNRHTKTYYIQYDCRMMNGKFFSCVAKNLEDARKKKDIWLKGSN